MKGICDGTSIKYNRNYAIEAEKVNIDFKLFCVSNNSLNIKGDAGIKRRFKLCQFSSQFKEEFKEDNFEKLEFVKNKNFGYELQNKYSNALLKLIFSYSYKYNKEGSLMPYPDEWRKEGEENMEDNNKFEEWFRDNFEIGGEYSISRDDFYEEMDEEMKKLEMKYIKDIFKRMKIWFDYKSQEKREGKRGFIYGFRLKKVEENEIYNL